MASLVWIIDGSLVARTILEITLRRLGIASSSYSEGNEALRDLWEEPDAAPGLMLIEGQLPDMDGYDVIMLVRRLLSRGQTAIVVLSNRNSILDRCSPAWGTIPPAKNGFPKYAQKRLHNPVTHARHRACESVGRSSTRKQGKDYESSAV